MGKRASIWTLLAFTLMLSVFACVPGPLLPTSPTPHAMPTSSPTIIAVPSPTWPDKLQLVSEVVLRPLPGVGHNPQAITVLNGRCYVANRNTDNVSVIEGNKVTKVIAVGDAPIDLVADSETGLVYVANEGEDSISIIADGHVVKTVPAPKNPACLAALDGRLYVGGRGENALAVLDGVSGERIATITLEAPIGILALAVNAATHLLYASVYNGVQIVDLETLAVVGKLTRDVYVTLGADPLHGGFFASHYDAQSNTHYLVYYAAFGQKELGRVPIGGDPRGVAVNPQNGRIYVADSWTNEVSIIDIINGGALRLVQTVLVGLRPLDVAVGETGQVYVVNSDSENVAVLDSESNHLLRVVPLSLLPHGMAVHTETGRLYVACASTNSVFVLDNGQVVAEVPAGLHPTEILLGPGGETLFVLNYVSGNLTLISTHNNQLLKTVDIGHLPQGLAIAPETGQLFVSDAVLDVKSQRLLRRTELLTIYRSAVKPIQIKVDAKAGYAYMVASNGVPGSNAGFVVYVVDLESGEQIKGEVGGLSMTDLTLDPDDQLIFSTAGRFGCYQLIINNASTLQRIATLDLPKYPAAIAYNPNTHHIFICLTSDPLAEQGPELWVLDNRGLGTVAKVALPGEPEAIGQYKLTVDAQRGYVYLSDVQRGIVQVWRDVPLPPPPTSTPFCTPTPWPTLTPESNLNVARGLL